MDLLMHRPPVTGEVRGMMLLRTFEEKIH